MTPTAEDVVIGAAYRALMRHYHPDTNPDPQAQARAQQISAAYAVLRDPVRRAEYDAQRGGAVRLWEFDEPGEPPPPMRTAGIATALLAALVVGAVWAWPRPATPPDPPSAEIAAASPAPKAEVVTRPSAPAVRPPPPAPRPLAPPEEAIPEDEPMVEAAPVRLAAAPSRPAPAARKRAAAAKPAQPSADPLAASDRVATLDRISSGFFSQSMVHASDAKKELLLAARDRSAAQRKACRSDSCVADAYVREIRETSAIMESRGGPE